MIKIVKRSVTEAILGEVKRMITSGELKEGDKLPNQHEFAAQLGVSRPSLREAMQSLALLGVIEQHPGVGTVIRATAPALLADNLDLPLMSDAEGTIELIETRRLIEVDMVELAVERATEEDLIELDRIMDNMARMARDGKIEKYQREDLLFHHAIAAAAHNRFVMHLFTTIRQYLEQFLRESFTVMPTMLSRSAEAHRRIFEAIKERDRAKAVAAMEHHLGEVQKAVQLYYDKKTDDNG